MTALGAFRDDFYNAISVLPGGQFNSTGAQTTGTLPATFIAGAAENYILTPSATALTLDSTVNIIAQLQQAVAVAYKAAISGFGAGVNPPSGVPNLFNLSFYVNIRNGSAGLTLTLGAGQTLTAGGLLTVATGVERQYLFVITSPTTIQVTDLGGSAVT